MDTQNEYGGKDFELIRIYIGEGNRHGRLPLYEAIVQKAREQGLEGATVFRGIMGFGRNSKFRTSKVLCLSLDLPLTIELVDEKDKIDGFLPILDDMVTQGLVIREKVDVLINRHNGGTRKDSRAE